MGFVDIPISMKGGFSSMETAIAHRKIMTKVSELKSSAEETARDLMPYDVADIDSTRSDTLTDLAPGLGHVIMIDDDKDGGVHGVELHYNPENGKVRQLVADTPLGKLTQGTGENEGDRYSPTLKWEENKPGGQVETTFFKFDYSRGTLTVMDPANETPAILGDANLQELTKGTIQSGAPIIIS